VATEDFQDNSRIQLLVGDSNNLTVQQHHYDIAE